MMSARVVAIVQARMGSTRLPGKVLRPLGDRPVLAWVVRAARAAESVSDVVIATSTESRDDPLVHFAEEIGCRVIRGSETDVLSRFALAADVTGADAIVRLTADCPLLDPRLIDQVVALWSADPHLDYVSTTLVRSLPRGLDVELVSRSALDRADASAGSHHRVHVTSWLYREGSTERTAGIVVQPDHSRLRVTLDTAQDAALLDALVPLLPTDRPPSWRDVVSVLSTRPDLVAINADVRQKPLDEG